MQDPRLTYDELNAWCNRLHEENLRLNEELRYAQNRNQIQEFKHIVRGYILDICAFTGGSVNDVNEVLSKEYIEAVQQVKDMLGQK